MVVQSDFDSAGVSETFAVAIDEHTPTIIKEVLKNETDWISDSYKKLIVQIGDLILQLTVASLDQFEIDPCFSDDLKR